MKPPVERFTIFVVCDSGSHGRAQAVTNFVRATDETGRRPGWHWDEQYPGRRQDGTDSAVTLIDNARPGAFGLDIDDPAWSRARPVYELECRKCRKPFLWKAERLYAALDQVHTTYRRSHGETGVSPVSLQQIAAIVTSLPQA